MPMSAVLYTSPSNVAPKGNILAVNRRNNEIEELDAAIGKLTRQMNACNYQLMFMLREFDERGGWLKWSFTDCVSWLRWRCDLSANAARDKMRVAHALKPLPKMSKAFESGALSYSKVRSLTRIATVETEEELVEMGLKLSAAHVEEHCRQRKNACASSTTTANSAHDNRSLRLWRNEHAGTMSVTIELSIEEGELFQQAVDKASMRIASDTADSNRQAVGDKSTWSATQADAAMLIIRDYLSESNRLDSSAGDTRANTDSNTGSNTNSNTNSKRCSTADRFQVVVHIDEQALVNGPLDDSSSIQSSRVTTGAKSTGTKTIKSSNGASELPISTVRRLCCDGSIIPIIENAKGEPLNVGRKVRTITTAIRRALWARDKGCVFPGCHCKRYVDGHHIKHWADGGETSLDNLVLLCTRHHRLVHEGGFKIEFDQNKQRFFRRPDGKAVPACGYRLDDWQDDYSANIEPAERVT